MERTGKFSDCVYASNHILAASKLLKGHDDEMSNLLLELSISLLQQVPYNEMKDFEDACSAVREVMKQ